MPNFRNLREIATMTEDKPIVKLFMWRMKTCKKSTATTKVFPVSHFKTLQDSSTQTEILTTVSVGTKPKTPPGVVTTGAQAVVKCSEQDAQANIELKPETSVISTQTLPPKVESAE